MSTIFRNYRLQMDDGHSIPVYEWLPQGDIVAVLHIAHGMAEYAQRYTRAARFFNTHGIAVYAHDHRGHGDAVKSQDELGFSGEDSFVKKVNDLRYLINLEKEKHTGKKIFLLGHSMGSFISQYFFQHYGHEIDGLMLSASNGIPDRLLPFGIAFAKMDATLFGKRHKSKMLDKLTFGKFNDAFKPLQTASDWLSRDPQEVKKYVDDNKSGFLVSSQLYYDFFRGIKSIFTAENINRIPKDVPVYIFSGDHDPVGLNGRGVIRLYENWKNAGAKDIQYKLYPGGRHEMLNETNRDEVMKDCLDWILAHSQ